MAPKTQVELPETQELETPEPKAEQPEGEAPPESEEPKAEQPPESEEPKAEQPKPLEEEEGHKRQGGWARKLAKLERQIERQNQELIQALQRGNAAPSATPKEKSPEEQAAEQLERMVDQRIQQRDSAREQQSQVAEFQRLATEARSKHADWDEIISGLDIPMNTSLGQALLTSEHGPELMYQLASNPTELARVTALAPIAQAREIGRLEAQVGAGASPAASQGKRPPPPPGKVGGTAPTSTRALESLPLSEYKKAQRARLKR